jgi:HK97 family phage prohead protease
MPNAMETRTLSTTLEIREVGDQGSGRVLTGLAVPYNVRTEVAPGLYEMVTPGAFAGSEHVVLRSEHGTTIGTLAYSESPDGLLVEGRIAETPAGDEAIALIKAGAWDRLSVGFIPSEEGTQFSQDGTVVRSKARLLEVSVVGNPAYGESARVLSLRSASGKTESETAMPDTDVLELRAEVTELRTANEDMQRRMATFGTPEVRTACAAAQFRSAGEWLKAIADPVTRAEALKVGIESRAFTGTQVADVSKKVPWLDDAVRLTQVNSVAVDTFRNAPLPATGMTADYLKFGASTLQVQQQVNEGDVLAFGKLNLDLGATSIKTYGGYTVLSFQAIQRSDVNVLDMSFNLLTAQAALRSNAAFIADLAAANASYQAVTIAAATFDGWVNGILDAQIALNNTGLGLPAETILMSSDVWRKALGITDSFGNRLMQTPGVSYGSNANNAGSADLPGNGGGIGGSLMGFPVRVDAGLAAGSMYVVNSNAAVVLGDRNPTRLGPDDDITRLQSELSVYFLQASAVQFASGIAKITVP